MLSSCFGYNRSVCMGGPGGGWEAGLPVSLTGLFSLPTFPSPTLAPAPFPQLPLLISAFSRSQFYLPQYSFVEIFQERDLLSLSARLCYSGHGLTCRSA